MTGITQIGTDRRTVAGARLKVRLLAEGLQVLPGVLDGSGAKPALRVRSGSCGGLDLKLADGTWVNAPIHEPWAKQSRLLLQTEGSGMVVGDGDHRHRIELVAAPMYYSRQSPSGEPMSRIGQLCSDRVGVGLTNICTFYRSRDDRCSFCSIGANTRNEHPSKSLGDIVATVIAAVDDPVAPARHVLLGGGTFDRDGGSAPQIAEAAAAVKAVRDVPVYAMITPPRDFGLLRELAAAGVDELGMNIEVFSPDAARSHIPGKDAAIGLARYWEALKAAVDIFGPQRTRSITVVGLEPAEATVRGVTRLASLGVMPILSPLRPLVGTILAGHRRQTADELWSLQERCADAADAYAMPLGPTCIACQSNTLTRPGHPDYRLY